MHWSSTILALTLRVIRLLYGGNEGAEMVNIVVNQYNVGLDVPAETIYPTWHSIICKNLFYMACKLIGMFAWISRNPKISRRSPAEPEQPCSFQL